MTRSSCSFSSRPNYVKKNLLTRLASELKVLKDYYKFSIPPLQGSAHYQHKVPHPHLMEGWNNNLLSSAEKILNKPIKIK